MAHTNNGRQLHNFFKVPSAAQHGLHRGCARAAPGGPQPAPRHRARWARPGRAPGRCCARWRLLWGHLGALRGPEGARGRARQNRGRPPETSGPSAAMLRPVSMTSVRAAEGESNSACENTNSVRTRHTRNAPAAVPDAVEHSGLGRALTRAESLRLRPVVSLSPRDNVRGPLVPSPRP